MGKAALKLKKKTCCPKPLNQGLRLTNHHVIAATVELWLCPKNAPFTMQHTGIYCRN